MLIGKSQIVPTFGVLFDFYLKDWFSLVISFRSLFFVDFYHKSMIIYILVGPKAEK